MANTSVIILLAPSKTMDLVSPPLIMVAPQMPLFLAQASQIASKMSGLSVVKLINMMNVSRPIAVAVHGYYANWDSQAAGKPALFAYAGDVYKGLQAQTLTRVDTDWAQNHVLIASGLYGLLRPYDGVQAYRLEMKAKLAVERRKNLYEFWGPLLSDYVAARGATWLCNCSSDEYAKATTKQLLLPVVTPVFFDTKPSGVVGTVPIYSKIMRGVMARWIINNRVTSPEQLEAFEGHGYTYDAARSRPGLPAFSRAKMTPLRFD